MQTGIAAPRPPCAKHAAAVRTVVQTPPPTTDVPKRVLLGERGRGKMITTAHAHERIYSTRLQPMRLHPAHPPSSERLEKIRARMEELRGLRAFTRNNSSTARRPDLRLVRWRKPDGKHGVVSFRRRTEHKPPLRSSAPNHTEKAGRGKERRGNDKPSNP